MKHGTGIEEGQMKYCECVRPDDSIYKPNKPDGLYLCGICKLPFAVIFGEPEKIVQIRKGGAGR